MWSFFKQMWSNNSGGSADYIVSTLLFVVIGVIGVMGLVFWISTHSNSAKTSASLKITDVHLKTVGE